MRRLALGFGILVLGAAWLWPIPDVLPGSFSAHMAIHVAVVAVAAPLLALGVAGGAFDPVRRASRLFAPIPASVLELIVVWSWHAPAPHHWARHSSFGVTLEQGSFLLCGLLVWLSVFGGEPRERNARGGAGVLALLLTSMHMTLLGALLALATRPLYAHSNHLHASGGLTPLADQHLGGAIMLLVGGLSYLLGALAVAVRLLRSARGPKSGVAGP